MLRAFVGLALPEGHRQALAGYLARCVREAPDFRWVGAESTHLTLRFLGAISEESLDRLSAGLRAVKAAPFQARLGPLGWFGGRARTRVIWLGLSEGVEPAAALAAECEGVAQAAGLPPEPRPFRPHVTLARARPREGARLPDLPPAPSLDAWLLEDFVLYESRPRGGSPPEYIPLERFGLRDR